MYSNDQNAFPVGLNQQKKKVYFFDILILIQQLFVKVKEPKVIKFNEYLEKIGFLVINILLLSHIFLSIT